MDTPGSRQPPKRKKRDPERNKIQQKAYRQRLYAKPNGIEEVKAMHRRRYHERMARLKANGEYEAFKAKKTQEGMQRYYGMTEEQRTVVKHKNAQCQKIWRQKMKERGTYQAYLQRTNAKRRKQAAEKKKSVGRGRMESAAKTTIREADGSHSTATLVLAGRRIGASLSHPVVAFGLGRVRP